MRFGAGGPGLGDYVKELAGGRTHPPQGPGGLAAGRHWPDIAKPEGSHYS